MTIQNSHKVKTYIWVTAVVLLVLIPSGYLIYTKGPKLWDDWAARSAQRSQNKQFSECYESNKDKRDAQLDCVVAVAKDVYKDDQQLGLSLCAKYSLLGEKLGALFCESEMGDKQNNGVQTGTTTSVPATVPSDKLCTNQPSPTDIGRDIYPIDPKYNGLGFLGQLFTAYPCGSARVSKIFGVKNGNYTLGSTIWTKNNPTTQLINTFKSIGFKCADKSTEQTCKKWDLSKTVKVDDIVKLEPFHAEFEADDCTICG